MTLPEEPLPARLGRYEVLGELGRGGMGRVLRALDPQIGREVAIKVLLLPMEAEADALERFAAEARLTGQLEHPNIVPVYDVGLSEEGRLFYVMRQVRGPSLGAVLAARDPAWGLHRLLDAFRAVCAAVGYAHHQGVLHQDLKPDNVLLGPYGEVMVLDWGLAILLRAGLKVDHGAPGHGLSGTPGFLAPERVRAPRSAPTAKADQWSLGATLYTLLCRRPPYEGATSRAVLEATLRGPPEDVRLRDPDLEIPHALAEICTRAMDPDPEARFADVGALDAALRAWQEGSERRTRALAAVGQADALLPKIEEQRGQAAVLAQQARALLEGVKGADPVERKRDAWALQDAGADALQRAAFDEVVWEQHLQGALQLVPDLHEAHVRLALHHRRALEEAEAAHDPGAAARAAWLLRVHDRGHHRRYLAGTGALTLHTDPPGARARLHPLVRVDRRLVPGEGQDLGLTPLVDVPLAPGSYLVVLEYPGRVPVQYPVFLRRADRWDGVPPGGDAPLPVHLPRAGALGPDDVYVPAGWFLAGGDPEATDSLSARRVWVDAFVARRHPVTNGEYAAWLDGLRRAGREDEVERLLPRDVPRPSHPLEGAPVMRPGPDGALGPADGSERARWASLPVTRIDAHSASTYAAAAGWRLPDELEREKLARGVDGRRYPWGDQHDPAFSCVVPSQALPQVVPVHAFPLDESVYGAFGLAGNVRDWCANRWTEDGSAADGERLVVRVAPPEVDFLSARGGCWWGTPAQARSATRFGDPPYTRFIVYGVRLFRGIG